MLARYCVLSFLLLAWTDHSAKTEQLGVCSLTGLPYQCTCSKHANDLLNVYCSHLAISDLPNLDFGGVPIHTFSLEGNNLTHIDQGDFFGLRVSRLVLSRNYISELDYLSFWGFEVHLDNLDISYNRFTSVPSEAFGQLRNLRTLNLAGNRIKFLLDNSFANLVRLEVLYLDYNPLHIIESDAFHTSHLYLLSLNGINITGGLQSIPTKYLHGLKDLSVAWNGLNDIPKGWFKHLQSLKSLTLDGNQLQIIHPMAFHGCDTTLKTLKVNDNALKKIPKHALRRLINLENLELRNNNIRKLHPRGFNHSANLVNLALSGNGLDDISPHAFVGMSSLERIDLRHNELITLDEMTFAWENRRIREVLLTDNLWLCNCLLKWLVRDARREDTFAEIFVDLDQVVCDRPDYLAGVALVNAPLRDLHCGHGYYYYYTYDGGDYDHL